MKSRFLAIAFALLASVNQDARPRSKAAPPETDARVMFQYRIPVGTGRGERDAFLWIPARAQHVRGVVMGGMTLMEREMAKDPLIRRACADQQLAIIFLKCGLGRADVQDVLDTFAEASGYRELSVAPLLFVGHSAGGPQAKTRASEMASRCFGLVQYRGGTPGGDSPLPPGIPSLMMVGQFDEFGGTMRTEAGRESWEGGRDAMAVYRRQNARHLASIVIEPGAGHFAWSGRNARYLATFIRKAAQARIPVEWPGDVAAPVPLSQIDPAKGWLTDLTIDSPAEIPASPYTEYEGDRVNTAWHFDREMAEATVAYHADGFGKKDQFIRWGDPHWVDGGARFFFTKLKWVGDGQMFEVDPVYADRYPSQYNGRGPRWPKAGEPVGHAAVPINVRPVGGPIVAAGPCHFRMQYDALAPATETGRVTFIAYSPGDDEYRYTEQVGMMPRGFRRLMEGKEQIITFPPVGDIGRNSGPVALQARSDSGLSVEYHVAYGPAVVVGNQLHICDIPTRSKFPITIKVVAYQFGSGVEPLVRTAVPVEQVIQITR